MLQPSSKADKTKEAILQSARKEFSAVGFREASLRRIAADAGVTTGSIYRYFENKDALFQTIIQPAEQAFLELHASLSSEVFVEAGQGVEYDKTPENRQIMALLDMVYDHFEAFYLLLACADGSQHGDFLGRFVEQETRSALEYLDTLKKSVNSSYVVDEAAVGYLVEAYVSAMFQPIRHRAGRPETKAHIRFLFQFFNDGWAGVEKAIMESVQ